MPMRQIYRRSNSLINCLDSQEHLHGFCRDFDVDDDCPRWPDVDPLSNPQSRRIALQDFSNV